VVVPPECGGRALDVSRAQAFGIEVAQQALESIEPALPRSSGHDAHVLLEVDRAGVVGVKPVEGSPQVHLVDWGHVRVTSEHLPYGRGEFGILERAIAIGIVHAEGAHSLR
jgi:hypothetical protein